MRLDLLKKIIFEELQKEENLGLTPDNGHLGLEGVVDETSPALEEKLVGKGIAKNLIQDLEDLDRKLGLFDASSLQKFPDLQGELIQLAADVSDKLRYIKDSTRQFRENKSRRDFLKKIIIEELCHECGMAMPPSPVEPPKDHSMDSQAGESVMAKGTLHMAVKSAQEIDAVLGDDVDLPEWLEAKLTKAADYLGIVSDYLTYKDSRGAMPAASMEIPQSVEPPTYGS